MSTGTDRAIAIAKRDLDDARARVRQCQQALVRAKVVAEEADKRLRELQGKPPKGASQPLRPP